MTQRSKKAKARTARPAPVSPKKKSKLSFFVEAVEELKKARWPTRYEAARLSALVLVVCVVIDDILWAIDYGFTKLLSVLFLRG
jgi:preprotein translocase SecE subunit